MSGTLGHAAWVLRGNLLTAMAAASAALIVAAAVIAVRADGGAATWRRGRGWLE